MVNEYADPAHLQTPLGHGRRSPLDPVHRAQDGSALVATATAPASAVAMIDYLSLERWIVMQIDRAAVELWPGQAVTFNERVPSVTSYVRKVSVGDRVLFAKYDLLGTSLVSLLHGRRGGWAEVVSAQREYLLHPDALHFREAAQLERLSAVPVSACPVAGCRYGVLFVGDCSSGVSLGEAILREPYRTQEFLNRAWQPLRPLHQARADGWPLIPERSIMGTFRRKFMGREWQIRLAAVCGVELTAALCRLVQLVDAMPLPTKVETLLFGDLKPEHVLFMEDRVVYLDPGVHCGSHHADLAKIVSRTLLSLWAAGCNRGARELVMRGMTGFVFEQLALRGGKPQLGPMLALIGMDIANILSTYLAAPSELPTTDSVKSVRVDAGRILGAFGRMMHTLVAGQRPFAAWDVLRLGVRLP